MAIPKDELNEVKAKFFYLIDLLGAIRYFKSKKLLPVFFSKAQTEIVSWETYKDPKFLKGREKQKEYQDALIFEIVNLLKQNEA